MSGIGTRPDLAGQQIEVQANGGLDYRVTIDANGEACCVESKVYTGLGCYHYRKLWNGDGVAKLTPTIAIRKAIRARPAQSSPSMEKQP